MYQCIKRMYVLTDSQLPFAVKWAFVRAISLAVLLIMVCIYVSGVQKHVNTFLI